MRPRLPLGAALAVCALVLTGTAVAQRAQQVVLPGPVPYPTEIPPLIARGALANVYLAPGLHVASSERVDVGVDGSGRPATIHVRQRLTVSGKGDYQLAVGAPIEDVRPGAGSQSDPGFRADQVLWAGFSPGKKVLAADVALRVPPAAPYLPLRVHLQREGSRVSLRIVNATPTPVMSYAGVVRAPEMARLLDATRRSSLAGERVKAAFATFFGEVHVPKRPLRIEAPLRVEGELDLPKREPVGFARVLGDGQPLSLEVRAEGEGTPRLRIEARPAAVVNLLRPPGAPTWAAAIRRRAVSPAELLSRLLGSRLRLVRADQYKTFLADPDSDGRSIAVYEYASVATQPPRVVPGSDEGGSDALLIALLIVASVVVVGGGLVAWAHS